MERNLSRYAVIAASIALISIPAAMPRPAVAGGGMTGGSTEITQILNHIELVSNVAEQVQTVANTLSSAQGIIQQLKQLNPTALAEMVGLPVEAVQAMADAYQVFNNAQDVYQDAKNVLTQAVSDAKAIGANPWELLKLKSLLSQKYGGVYKQIFDQEQGKLKKLQDVSNDVQQQVSKIQKIDSNISGLQALASQNLNLQKLMIQLNQSIQTMNTTTANEKLEEANRQSQAADFESQKMQDYMTLMNKNQQNTFNK